MIKSLYIILGECYNSYTEELGTISTLSSCSYFVSTYTSKTWGISEMVLQWINLILVDILLTL